MPAAEAANVIAEATLDSAGRITAANDAWRVDARPLDSPEFMLCRGQVGDDYLAVARLTGGIGPALAAEIMRARAGRSQASFDYLAEGRNWRVGVASGPVPGSVTIRHQAATDSDGRSDGQPRALAAMSQELLVAGGVESLYRRVVELPRKHLGLTRCGLLVVDGHWLRGTFGTDFQGQTVDERGMVFPHDRDGDWASHFRRRPHLESGWDLQYGRRSYWTPRGAVLGPTGWIALTPVTCGGEILGFLSNDPGLADEPYDATLQELLAVYATIVGGMLAQRRAERAEQRSHRRIALLHQVSAAVADAQSPVDLATRVTAVLRDALPIDAFFLQAYDYASRTIRLAAAFDTFDGEFRLSLDEQPERNLAGSPIFERLTREPGPILIRREAADPLQDRLNPLGDASRPSATLAFLPIIRGERLEGVMSAQTYQSNAYDDDAVDLLAAVAAQLGPVLESLRLRDELRQQAEELRVNDVRYRAVLMASNGVVYERDETDGRYRFSSEGIEHLTGYPAAELTAARFEDLIVESQPVPIGETPLLAAARQLVAGERMQVSRRNLRLTTTDGRELHVADTAVRIEGDDGQPRLTLGLLRDITAARVAEQERLQHAALIEQMQDAVVVADPNGLVRYVNPAFEQLTGFSREEVQGRTAVDLAGLTGGSDELIEAIGRAIHRGTGWRGRFRRLCKDGSRVPIDAIIATVRDNAGRPTAIIGVERDLRPLEAYEERLRQTVRMEAVGRLAGGLAHDFNNLLTTILGYADLLGQSLPSDSPTIEDALQIAAAAQRATELTQQLLALQGKPGSRAQECQAARFLIGLQPILDALLPERVEVEVQDVDESLHTLIDPPQIERAMLDLASWCATNMGGAGRLKLTVRRAVLPEQLLAHLPEPGRRDAWLCAELSDTGPALDEQQRERIFEPFLSYDAPTVTTNLGLATAYSLIAQNHGLLECVGEPDSGVRFRVWLPLIQPTG